MKLSIITINYNNCEGLCKTIDSVISQTCQDFEWIIVDGGSTDGSKELIAETAAKLESLGWTTEQFSCSDELQSFTIKQSSTVAYLSSIDKPSYSHRLKWCSEKDKGIYNAMNKGIVMAQGEYMNFMNSGDTYYDNNVLCSVHPTLFDADVIYGDWMCSINGNRFYGDCPHEMTIAWFAKGSICHQAMFIRSAELKTEGYDETYKICADRAKWVKMICEGKTFTYIPIMICVFQLGGISSTQEAQRAKEHNMVSKIPPLYVQKIIHQYAQIKDKLEEYDNCILTNQALALSKERTIYSKLLHISILFLKYLKKTIDLFGL